MRANLIRALKDTGYDVAVLAPNDPYARKLEELGVTVINVPMKMNKNPVTDLLLLLRFRQELSRLRPSLFLGYTAKPNIFGTLAANSLGIPTINNISGLGAGFIADGFVTKLMKWLYRASLARSSMVFFQNPDDAEMFERDAIVTHGRTDILPGSGVDISRFSIAPLPSRKGRNFRFLLIARLLRDKGVEEFVEAARTILADRNDVEFRLLGSTSVDNPAAIEHTTLDHWISEGIISHQDFRDDVRPEILAADCVVLPSYREGTPRALLEAAACGRPIITTDAAGCRETVIDGHSGYLCVTRSSHDLASKMKTVLDLSEDELARMGRNGRILVETRFDETKVISRYLDAVKRATRQ